MVATTLSISSQLGECVDKAHKIVGKRSSELEDDIAVELQLVMAADAASQPCPANLAILRGYCFTTQLCFSIARTES